MNESTYSTKQGARDATQYAIAKAILRDNPKDPDAKATIKALRKKYGATFFED